MVQPKNVTQEELYREILEYLEINNICTIGSHTMVFPGQSLLSTGMTGQTCMLSRKAEATRCIRPVRRGRL